MSSRHYTPLDLLVLDADRALRAICGLPQGTNRPSPANSTESAVALDPASRRRTGRLMRVNLAGEVAAQALYHGQGAATRDKALASRFRRAAEEEGDHLLWCRERLASLGARPSLFNPFWYVGSFAIGAAAGLIGDRASLGFLEETELQVVEHLDKHLARLPALDAASRAVLLQMREDEARHALGARVAGGKRPPRAGRIAMRLTARIMTGISYWF